MKRQSQPVRAVGIAFLFFLLSLNVASAAAQDLPVLQGRWVATAGGKQSYRGKWIGQALPGDPRTTHGSWTLTNEAGRTVLGGTWTARKAGQTWRGTWSAETQQGRSFSGTWKGDLPGGAGTGLQRMFEQAFEKEVSGSWRSGSLQGFWWLEGLRSPTQKPPPASR